VTSPNDGLILREDAALKAHLQGVTVRDVSSPATRRKVDVYFRLPEQEAKRRVYPYITIDLLAITRDAEREYRGPYYFSEHEGYCPPTRTPEDNSITEYPIPLLFTYQVTSFARFIQHDLQIVAQMLTNQLAERFGAVAMVTTSEVVDDNSVRRLDVVSGPTDVSVPDPTDPSKRIFRKAWTVTMSSEYFPSELLQLPLVETVIVDVFETTDGFNVS
jgi:hypothetical protein